MIDAYIATCAASAQPALKNICRVVRKAAPGAEEIMSYRMPAFRQGRILINFAAFKKHIWVFPPVRGNANLERALAKYMGPKGNLRFPLDEALPYALIEKIVRHRLKQAAKPQDLAKRDG